MSLGQEQAGFLLDIGKLDVYATSLGFRVTSGEHERTVYQQAEYVRTGRSKTMESMHILKLAGDRNFFKIIPPMSGETWINGMTDKEEAARILRPLGEYWESLNPKNKWGGFFKSFLDLPHFERRR